MIDKKDLENWMRRKPAVDRVLDGVAAIALHEADALNAHWAAAGERLRIAREARTPGELLQDQLDLLPESRNRFARDHALRRVLWRGLMSDLRAVGRSDGV